MDPTFRWQKLNADADSLVVKLEEGYIDVVPVDTLHGWAGNLGKLARHSDNGTQILSRHYYWMGRIANRTGARSLGYLNKARELCDSVRFPYDAMRIGILLTLRNDTLSAAGRYARLKHYERFIDLDNDDFMKASLLLDLGHILYDVGEEERALQNYREADAIYQRLGMTTYHLKTSLNIANMLNMQGRTEEARELSLRLLESPVARHDTTFYNNLRLVAYHITHDTAYLEAGYGEEFFGGMATICSLNMKFCLAGVLWKQTTSRDVPIISARYSPAASPKFRQDSDYLSMNWPMIFIPPLRIQTRRSVIAASYRKHKMMN